MIFRVIESPTTATVGDVLAEWKVSRSLEVGWEELDFFGGPTFCRSLEVPGWKVLDFFGVPTLSHGLDYDFFSAASSCSRRRAVSRLSRSSCSDWTLTSSSSYEGERAGCFGLRELNITSIELTLSDKLRRVWANLLQPEQTWLFVFCRRGISLMLSSSESSD